MSLVGLCGRRKCTVVKYAVVLLCFSLLALVFRLPVVEFVGNEMKNIRRKLLEVLGKSRQITTGVYVNSVLVLHW